MTVGAFLLPKIMPFSGIKPGSKLERDIDECMASIRGNNPGMGKSQAIAICRSRLRKKMSDELEDKEKPDDETKGMHGLPSRHEPERERDHGKDDEEMMGEFSFTMGATSFAQVREAERAQEAAREVRKLANQVPVLVEGIFKDPTIEDKDAAIADLGPEFSAFVLEEMSDTKERWQPLTDAVVKALRPLFGKKKEGDPPEDAPASEAAPETENSFTVWKEKSGRYRWMAHYSNNFRDRDNPPEIISEQSHMAFVKAVNAGEKHYPELWLWHVGGDAKWGESDFVGYDDRGFAIATGLVDKGKEWVGDALNEFEGNLLASHGMPPWSVSRDPQDPTIIIRHTTKEISPLPAKEAANEHTGFSILDEVKEMAFSKEERAKLLVLGVNPDTLEAQTSEKAREAEGLEKKEADKADKQEGDSVSREEVADLVKSVAESTSQLVTVVSDLAERIETLEANKLTLDKETIERTPGASLTDLYKSAIGSEETKIDGRKSLAKSGPEEAPIEAPMGSRVGGGLSAHIARRNREIEGGGVQ